MEGKLLGAVCVRDNRKMQRLNIFLHVVFAETTGWNLINLQHIYRNSETRLGLAWPRAFRNRCWAPTAEVSEFEVGFKIAKFLMIFYRLQKVFCWHGQQLTPWTISSNSPRLRRFSRPKTFVNSNRAPVNFFLMNTINISLVSRSPFSRITRINL